ncbi:MAG: demethoxyubiquinone hydroxylase family protein [Proteobacteria bacterium]|nr:demethoxyubiquinone hydroxylase family protein [Pseudomonadota bacterium]
MKKNNYINSLLRVNHAGEYGALRIYDGQLAAISNNTKDLDLRTQIEHMRLQEERHFEYFKNQITMRHVRPTLFMPVWHAFGFMLGKLSYQLGKDVAMATTSAVEEVIEEHYQDQIDMLSDYFENEDELMNNIKQFRIEELEHKDIGDQNHLESNLLCKTFKSFTKLATKIAIKISKSL